MITYPNETEARVGDSVLLDHGAHPGVIYAVIETAAEMHEWNVDAPGLMVEATFYGMAFIPAAAFARDEIKFVSRRDT